MCLNHLKVLIFYFWWCWSNNLTHINCLSVLPSVLAPVGLINTESTPKVRYYVREFDGHAVIGNGLTARHRSASYGNLYESKRRKAFNVDGGANSDTEVRNVHLFCNQFLSTWTHHELTRKRLIYSSHFLCIA